MVAIYLLFFATFVSVSLISFDIGDPSFNLATDQLPKNITGASGALFADLLRTSVGIFAATFFAIFPAIWALILLRKKNIHLWPLRSIAAVVAIIFISSFMSQMSIWFKYRYYRINLNIVFTWLQLKGIFYSYKLDCFTFKKVFNENYKFNDDYQQLMHYSCK